MKLPSPQPSQRTGRGSFGGTDTRILCYPRPPCGRDNRAWYVLANFRETYLSSIKPGMEAEVYLLSYPGRRFRGIVQGIGWANKPQDGATAGVLPQVEQTLNWVRLANRFQVRVRLEEHDPERPFRMGTTAVVTIRGFSGGTAAAPRVH